MVRNGEAQDMICDGELKAKEAKSLRIQTKIK